VPGDWLFIPRRTSVLRSAYLVVAFVVSASAALALSGSSIVYAAGKAKAAPAGPVLTFEVDGLDAANGRFANRVLVGGQEVAVLDAADGFETVEVPIPERLLSSGQTEVVIESTPAVDDGPVDTFTLRDVRLVLGDGAALRDRDHEAGRRYEITGERGNTGVLAPGKYNPMRRYLFALPSPDGAVSKPAAPVPVVAGVEGSADAKPLREDDEAVSTRLSAYELSRVGAADGKAVVTKVSDGFAYQQFDVDVTRLPSDAQHVQVDWKGTTVAGDGASLFAFDHHLGRWVEVAAGRAPHDGSKITLAARVDRDSFAREGTVRLLVMQRQFEVGRDTDATIAWVTDTQFQTQANLRPQDLPGQIADWLAANRKEEGIDYMAFTGDLAENGGADPSEFAYLSEALRPLDMSGFPYGVVPGNHDYFGLGAPCVLGQIVGTDPCPVNAFGEASKAADADPRLAVYGQYFGADRFADERHYGGQFRDNENHFDVVDVGGRRMAFLYVGWDAQPEEFTWAVKQLRGPLADIPVMLAMHEYLDVGETMDQKGEAILSKLVRPHDNVFGIISGHYHGVAYQVRRTDDGRVVLELLHDYQDESEGGAGYFRLLRFDFDRQQLSSTEYSPHHDDFLIEDFDVRRQEYTVPLDLRPGLKRRVATDLLAVGTRRSDP
jgi:hypothetical protein